MEHLSAPACSALMHARLGWALALVALVAACGGPVREPQRATGEMIAFGAGPSGARDACFTCHGFNGEGDGRAPRLAGLNAGYLSKQLLDYANGDRADPIMAPIARALSDNDRRAVSAYYAALDRAPTSEEMTPLALYLHGDEGRGIRACANCHGPEGEGRGHANPAIAGQPRAYTIEQLQRWKRSVRRNDARDVMGAAARPLHDEEIEALAIYVEGLGS